MRSALLLLVATFSPNAFRPRERPGHGLEALRYAAGLEAQGTTREAAGAGTLPSVALRAPASEMVTLPGGTFLLGATPGEMAVAVAMCRREVLQHRCEDLLQWIRSEGVSHEVRLDAFALDRFEVNVASYRRCMAAGACAAPGFRPHDLRFDQPDLPVVDVRWEDARAFCAWRGARLPTEAEWELAAKGVKSRLFPWGAVYNPHLANHGIFTPYIRGEGDGSDGFEGLAPVGSFPDGATPEGIEDLAGNAGEWVADLFDTDEQGFGYPPVSQLNPTGPATGAYHVIRGGDYERGAVSLRTTARALMSAARSPAVGFRCAKSIGPRSSLSLLTPLSTRTPMLLAHFSDLHVLDLEGVGAHRFLNKRLTGYANLRFKRSHSHRSAYVRAIARELAARKVDHVAITGDLTNLALEPEFAAVKKLLADDLGLGPDQVSVVPGNHDLYTRGSLTSRRFATSFAPYLVSDLPQLALDLPVGPFPFVKLRGDAAIIGLSSAVPRLPLVAAGVLGKPQVEALRRVLSHPEVQKRTAVLLLHHPAHNPPSRVKTMLEGLHDAALLWSAVDELPHGLILHGHLHRRVERPLVTKRGTLRAIGATSASLEHEEDARMAGFNLYEIDASGVRAVTSEVFEPAGGTFRRVDIPTLPGHA